MSQIIKTYQQQAEPENPKANKAYKVVIAVCAAAIAAAGIMFALRGTKIPERAPKAGGTGLEETAVPVDEVNILGNYMVKPGSLHEASCLTGYIETDALGQIALHVLSEYEPKVYPLTINPDGTVFNTELGQGKMTFRKVSDKTTITFTNDTATCVLVK